MVKTDNMVEYTEYQEYDEYGNYTDSDEEYDQDYTEYILENFEFPPIVNCTCFRSDIEHELQYRKKEVIKEGSIGGVACGTIKESRTCVCLNYGMYLIKHEADSFYNRMPGLKTPVLNLCYHFITVQCVDQETYCCKIKISEIDKFCQTRVASNCPYVCRNFISGSNDNGKFDKVCLIYI